MSISSSHIPLAHGVSQYKIKKTFHLKKNAVTKNYKMELYSKTVPLNQKTKNGQRHLQRKLERTGGELKNRRGIKVGWRLTANV